jgi:hypothetical protein
MPGIFTSKLDLNPSLGFCFLFICIFLL